MKKKMVIVFLFGMLMGQILTIVNDRLVDRHYPVLIHDTETIAIAEREPIN